MLRQVVADALERNSLGTSVTVDPAEDQIDGRPKGQGLVDFFKGDKLVDMEGSLELLCLCASVFQQKGDGHM